MKRRSFIRWLPAVQALLLLGCGDSLTGPEILAVRGGTSFGFCLPTAYCETSLEVTEGSAVLIRTSRALGEVRTSESITDGEWDSLVAAVDEDRLQALPAVIGCPDCADGGAEWVEVTTDERTKRVTFEFGSSPPGIETLVTRVRALRTRIEALAERR